MLNPPDKDDLQERKQEEVPGGGRRVKQGEPENRQGLSFIIYPLSPFKQKNGRKV